MAGIEILMRALRFAATAIAILAMMSARTGAQTSLPEITVTPPQQPPAIRDQLGQKESGDRKNGSDGKGDSHALDRLNEQLRRKVDETNPSGNTPPLDARSPDTRIGIVNIPGVQQQYGKNFGNSVVPYRPPPPNYAPPLGHR